MLAFFQRYFEDIQDARSDADIARVLARLTADFGFESGFLVEFGASLDGLDRVVDTLPERSAKWKAGLGTAIARIEAIREMMARGPGVFRGSTADAQGLAPEARHLLEGSGLGEFLAVPVTTDGRTAGLVGLAGKAPTTPAQDAALPLIAYTLFAQLHSIHGRADLNGVLPALTKREREVLQLSAEGLTSQEIAKRLGMSPRTVNQHVDNVADKLGTKNRAHTVAEVIRHGLLH